MGRPIQGKTRVVSNDAGNYSQFAGMDQNLSRLVTLHGDVSENSISAVIAHLLFLAEVDGTKPIQLIISTYGGSVDEMFALYDIIKCLPCPVHTFAVGKVMSAGVLLFAAGTKGHRYVGKNARFMMHRLQGGSYGSVLENEANNASMKHMQDTMNLRLKEESSLSLRKIEKIMSMGVDHYISASKVIEYGLGDKLLTSSQT